MRVQPKPLPPLSDETLEHLGVIAADIQRNRATEEGVRLFTLCAGAVVDELLAYRRFRDRIQAQADRMRDAIPANVVALRPAGGRADA